MEKSMARMLVETVVKKALKSIQDDPERGIRNLVDMGLQFSEGRFQKNFFTVAQTMLQNENSAYYSLVRNMVKLAGVPIREAVRMATANPARLVRVHDRKGSIAVGMDADLVLFDENIDVTMTMSRGKVVSRRAAE